MPTIVMPHRQTRALLAFTVTLVLSGCGGGSKPDPKAQVETVVTTYLKAVADGDGELACKQLTGEQKRTLISNVQDLAPGATCERAIKVLAGALGEDEKLKLREAKIQSSSVSGDTATVKVEGTTNSAALTKAGDLWLISRGLFEDQVGTATSGGSSTGSGTPDTAPPDINTKPVIPKQKGAAPRNLVIHDLIVGTGKEAKDGDTVNVDYVGVLRSTGKEFDSSWEREDFSFTLGAGQVIKGWDRGIVGMKEGGRRRLIIPPDLAYGAEGNPPTIPANAWLVFDVDLRKVNP